MTNLEMTGLLGLALLLGLKYHRMLHPAWIAFGLLGVVTGLALNLLAIPRMLNSSSVSFLLLALLLLMILQSWRLARASFPPWPFPGRRLLRPLFRVFFGFQALLLPVAAVVYADNLSVLLPLLCLASLALAAGGMVVDETIRLTWQRLGLIPVPHPLLAWLLAGMAFQWMPYGWIVACLIKVNPRYPRPQETLTPCQATLLLRLPLATANRCLQRLPMDLQRQWFRPDATRLHLLEPLLETQNAPGYFFALAEFINQRYFLNGGEGIQTEEQLADFCLRYPDVSAEALLNIPLKEAIESPPGWTCNNLGSLRKASKWTQLRHLLLLQRIVRAAQVARQNSSA